MTKSGILVRTDASAASGTGHSMRCLALAQACRDFGLPAALAYAEMTPSQQQRWQSEATSCLPIGVAAGSLDDADVTARLSQELGSAWVVIDSYRFGAAYQRQLKTHGPRVLCLDDYVHAEHYDADVLLNQNAGARAEQYDARGPSTRLLIGSRYALLRREFRQRAHDRPHPIRAASRVLVTLEGPTTAQPGP